MAKTVKKPRFQVECLENFRDKHTRKIHKKGDKFNVTEERFKEILTVKELVKKVEAEKTAE